MMMGNEIIPTLPGPASHTTRLPLLVDICLNVSQIFILLVAILTAILSFLANVGFITVILRTAIAIICVGIPVYALNYLLGRFYVQATVDEMKRALPASEKKKDLEEVVPGELEKEA